MAAPTASSTLDAALRHDRHAPQLAPMPRTDAGNAAARAARSSSSSATVAALHTPQLVPTSRSNAINTAGRRVQDAVLSPCSSAAFATPRTPRPAHPSHSDANDAAVSSAATRSPPRRSTPCSTRPQLATLITHQRDQRGRSSVPRSSVFSSPSHVAPPQPLRHHAGPPRPPRSRTHGIISPRSRRSFTPDDTRPWRTNAFSSWRHTPRRTYASSSRGAHTPPRRTDTRSGRSFTGRHTPAAHKRLCDDDHHAVVLRLHLTKAAAHLHWPTHGPELHRAAAGERRHRRHASGKGTDAQDNQAHDTNCWCS